MPIEYLRKLAGRDRRRSANHRLGRSLAFIAGAVNAGGFLAVGQYTSHMTGIVSSIADDAVLGHSLLVTTGIAALVAFLLGAATTAILVNWARRRHLHSEFALSLLVEAVLLLVFGLLGASLAHFVGWLLPATTILLCFIMGLQNAIITKISNSEIRTTHLTGMVTDIGIELGKLFYINRSTHLGEPVQVNGRKLLLLLGLVGSFLAGALMGALGFKHLGYIATVPLAIWLALMAAVPIADDLYALWHRHHDEEANNKPRWEP